MWLIIGIIDTIYKGFRYGWMILIPLLVLIILLIIKRKKIDNFKPIISVLLFVFFAIIFTSRVWGPSLYTNVIDSQIGHKEKLIEEELEIKYNKNFTLHSKTKTELVDKNAGAVLGQDITYDYATIYKFIDDDGVLALVMYKKDYGIDYYQLKKTQHDIEQSIYEYANKLGITDEFYVKVLDTFESIEGNQLIPNYAYNEEKYTHGDILFVMPKAIDNSKELMLDAIKNSKYKYLGVKEYVVKEDEYKKIKNYYESDQVKYYLNDSYNGYSYDIKDENTISHRYYYYYYHY